MFRWLMIVLWLVMAPFAMAMDKVDVNSANIALLDTLPGIGPAKAQAIVDFRAQNGPFSSPEALVQVPGIGPATLANIRMLVVCGADDASPEPVETTTPAAALTGQAPTEAPVPSGPASSLININTATAAQLETLPGIGPTKAVSIVADRTTNGPYSSCAELSRVNGIGPATVANVSGMCATE